MAPQNKIEVENINHPGTARSGRPGHVRCDETSLSQGSSRQIPGLTLAQISERLAGELPQDLFPGGAKAGWWAKTVQLDLEAKGLVRREKASPIRLYRA